MKLKKEGKARSLLRVKHLLYIFVVLSLSYTFVMFVERSSYSFDFLRFITAKVLVYLLGGKLHGTIVELSDANLYVDIVRDCVGWKTLVALVTMWLISPFNWKTKLFLVATSFPLAFFINLMRILLAILLAYVFNDTAHYSLYDMWVFRIFNLGFVLGVWWIILHTIREK